MLRPFQVEIETTGKACTTVYLVGPVVGAVLAALLYDRFPKRAEAPQSWLEPWPAESEGAATVQNEVTATIVTVSATTVSATTVSRSQVMTNLSVWGAGRFARPNTLSTSGS